MADETLENALRILKKVSDEKRSDEQLEDARERLTEAINEYKTAKSAPKNALGREVDPVSLDTQLA